MIPLGVGIAASTRIGNAIGAQCPNLARTATYSSLLLGFAIACTSSSFFIIVRDVWGMLWTEDETVVKLIGTVMPLAAFYQLADGLNCICGGIFRGVGHQKVGAVINLTGFYVIGIPVGMILAFKYGMGLLGLWVGISVGLVVQSLFELGWISQIKWPLESENARKRLMVRRASEAVVASSSSSCLGECGSFGRSISETARLLNEEDEGTNGSHGYGTLEKDRVGSPSYSSDGTVRGGDEETI